MATSDTDILDVIGSALRRRKQAMEKAGDHSFNSPGYLLTIVFNMRGIALLGRSEAHRRTGSLYRTNNTVLGWPYAIRADQEELFRIVER